MNKAAFLFAGQGSQYVGMGKDLYDSFPEARAVFDKAEEALGFALKRHCFEGPQDLLKATNISQPAIVTASIAAYEAFKAHSSIKPDYVAGLSLGEYSALIASGALSFEDGIKLVKQRGALMDDASRKHPGKMAAVIELDVGKIKELCLQSGAEIANLNSPAQTVITGKPEAVEKAVELCAQAGAKRVIPLEVSGGFHSSLMTEASMELRLVLERANISNPQIPLVANCTARPEYRLNDIIENLVLQMRSAVRWEESMRFLLGEGVSLFYEFGPGKVLKGLMRRIEPAAQVVCVEKKEDVLQVGNSSEG